MVNSYATRIPIIHFAFTGTMAAGIWKSLNVMEDQATAASV